MDISFSFVRFFWRFRDELVSCGRLFSCPRRDKRVVPGDMPAVGLKGTFNLGCEVGHRPSRELPMRWRQGQLQGGD